MRALLLTICFALLLLSGLSCKKGTNQAVTSFRGKIIMMNCGTAAIDIEGATGTGSVWVANSATTYQNAINVGNYCYLADQKLQPGDTIVFNIVKENPTPNINCAVTLCYLKGPDNMVYITDVRKARP